MLATSVRDRPCRARLSRSSSGRLTTSLPSSCAIVIGLITVCESWPFGPFTVTFWPSIVTSTPEGTGIGSRPIRDMLFSSPQLPDVGEDFPAHATLAGLLVREQAG